MSFICLNGDLLPAESPVLNAANRSYRYGDGLFETIKVEEGAIKLASYHFDRLFEGIALLGYKLPAFFTTAKIQEEISRLCHKNNCEKLARVRLSVSGGNGGLFDGDNKLEYLIECWTLDKSITDINSNGLEIGIYPNARKSCDRFSNLKSASFLPYVQAAAYARQSKLNDCLVLNTREHIADSTIANLFLVKNGNFITPSLDQGCVNGVMRKHIVQLLSGNGYTIVEQPVSLADVDAADEIFLTNAIRGIKWVGSFGARKYGNAKTVEIFNRFFKTI